VKEVRVGVIFAADMTGRGGCLGIGEGLFEYINNTINIIKEKLNKMFPNIQFKYYNIFDIPDEVKVVEETKDVDGYLLFSLNCGLSLGRSILMSGKPVVLIAETYGNTLDALLEGGKAVEENRPVIRYITRDITNDDILYKYIKYLEVIGSLKRSKILLILDNNTLSHVKTVYPLTYDITSYTRSLRDIFGLDILMMDVEEFKEKFFNKINDDEAKIIADKWIKESKQNLENNYGEILNAAKLYLAMKAAMNEVHADAIAIDDIVLYWSGKLRAWPCLGYMELIRNNEGVPACEADIASAALELMMKYLANRPGFINDPSIDMAKDEVVHYHCFAPITPYGYGDSKRAPYTITPAHFGSKRASIYVELPVEEPITALGLSPDERIITIYTGKSAANEYSIKACATKLVVRTNTKALVNKWVRRAGWHRVVFYGDWKEDVQNLARLLGLKVVVEDSD
jgi:L-fucose isomerase-like protein